MKRIKNFVIGGIENKVFNLILMTVILLTAAYLAVSAYHGKMLKDLAADSAERQQTAIEETISSVMDSVVDSSMYRSTGLEAYIVNEMFYGLETRVRMLGEYAEKLFSEPDSYPRTSYSAPDAGRNGEVLPQTIFADGVDDSSPELKDRIGLAANLSDMMISLFGVSAETNSCFIALPEGVFLVTDDRAAAKYSEDGSPVSYDPRTRPWYQKAVEEGQLIFTDVETDAFTGDVGIVCAKPVYVDGHLEAVVGSDLFLTSMQEYVQTSEENGGFMLIVNDKGHVVFSPKTDGVFMVRPSSEAVDLRQSENTELAAVIDASMKELTQPRTIALDDGGYYICGAPVETVGWALISLFSQESAGIPAEMLKESYGQIQAESTGTYLKNTSHSRNTGLFLLILVTLITLAGALFLGKKIVTPLNTITKRISELNEKNLEFKMEDAYRTGDEIEVLAESFASLSHKTVEYVDRVKKVTAEKERISAELSMATNIQAAMLPHIFPAFPDRPDFDIYASMKPAKEVGGDFYDYFLIDQDHLCMVMADVSGKGVPAALFMMASKIILQSCAMLGQSVVDIMTKTNEAICSNNEAEMFVTVWLGILELSTGRLTAANAGHEYPVLKQENGVFEVFRDQHSFVIGGMEDSKYKQYELQLEPGDKVFVYTDGVPEATNSEDEMFGTQRMLAAVNEKLDADPQTILENVSRAVSAFVGSAPQFDDLTMMCVEYRGMKGKKTS